MSETAGRVADATGNWVDSLAPAYSRPYLRLARLDRPIGSWLLLMPCWWSVGLAGLHQNHFPSVWHIVLFFIGAFAMRGAGCTWNDLVDRDIDEKVERTRSRPIPSKQVTVAQATLFMLAQALVGLLVLIQFNHFTVITGFASLLVVVIYPFMKRITYWPQIFLGLAFSWGALMGWPAAFGRTRLATAGALRGIDLLGDRLRHDLCTPGSRGRPVGRHQVNRVAVRGENAHDAGELLRGGSRVDLSGRLDGGRRIDLHAWA